MKFSQRLRMGIYLSDDEGAGGGGSAVAEKPVERPFNPTIVDLSGDDDEGAEGDGAEGSEGAEGAGAEGAEGEGAEGAGAEGEGEGAEGAGADDAEAQAKAKQAEHEQWAKDNGFVKKEETLGGEGATAAPPIEDLTWTETEREQAFREAEEQGHDSDWAEDRAVELIHERVELNSLKAGRPAQISYYEGLMVRDGLPKEAAPAYFDNLLRVGFHGGPKQIQDPKVQHSVLAHAIGSFVLRERAAGRPVVLGAKVEEGAEIKPEHVSPANKTPVKPNGGSAEAEVASLKDPGDKEYIAKWETKHKRKVTKADLAQMREDGDIG